MTGLKQPNALRDEACLLAACLSAWRERPAVPMQEKLMTLGPEKTERMIALEKADALARRPEKAEQIEKEAAAKKEALGRLLRDGACYSLRQLAVRGQDLAAAGLSGPQIGEAMNGLLLRVVRGEVPNERAALLAALQKK